MSMLISGIQKFTVLDFPEKVACIVFTPGCNFRCGYCHNSEFVLPEEIQKIKKSFIPEDTLFRFLDERRGVLDGVVITGGEPTVMGDLIDFIQKVKQREFLVKLDTNGSNPDVLRTLLAEKLVDYVAMDMKASLAEYPRLVGSLGKPDKIAQSIQLLISGGVRYEFRSTLVREFHTSEMINDMARELAGAKVLYLQSFRPGHTLDPAFQKKSSFTSEETKEIEKVFLKTVTQVFIR